MSRALVIAPQWIGDAVMSEPLLAKLAARGETLAVAALPWVAPVYRAMPQVGDVIELPFAHGLLDWEGRRRVAGELRGRYDSAYVLPNTVKSALIPFLARIPRRVGYHGEGRFGLLNERLPNPEGRPPMVAFYSALAGAPDDATPPRLVVPEATLADVTARAHVERGRYFAFAPGAEYGPAKRWPVEHYAALARALQATHALPVLLLGSAKEADLCEQISKLAPGACRVLAGRTSLGDAMALIAAARGVVSNDSGLMHVAAAFGTPQVAVFGSTSPLHTPPLNAKAQVLWLKEELHLDCMPCFERTCRYGHTRCLVDVPPQRVEAALEKATR
ncbi:MAG: lipopolysaccharide heptosyltransferase II [Rhizobacter sp.]